VAETKPFSISKHDVWEAYERVKANRGVAGVDGQSLAAFEKDLKGNLYKIWNRMSSGSYVPPPVRLVEIPKGDGRMRPLGIPTVGDRVAQTVAKRVLESKVEPKFHPDSYGYRPGKSALDAVATARQRCWRMAWVIDLDIAGFFDHLRHDLVLKAVRHHTDLKWLHLYVERWLKAPLQLENGTLQVRAAGTPQGGVVSPILANLFMHHAFDDWMKRHCPGVPFERYADDALIHCHSKAQAEQLLEAVRERLRQCGLELHPTKTKLVYCKDDDRRETFEPHRFDFLGYTFQPRRAKNRHGKFFVSFLPAISNKAATAVRQTIRDWRLAFSRNNQTLADLARLTDPYVRGWMNYYGRFYRSRCVLVLRYLNDTLVRWAMRKYKRLRRHHRRAAHWLVGVAGREPRLFAHWYLLGLRPGGRMLGAV
jgi:RNA-directed DNA polymerase